MVTSQDIANVAGVSRATVSAVINNKKIVNIETRKKVLRTIKELNYRPDNIARSLKMKSTRTIGVIIPDISNPIFSYAVKGIENYANHMYPNSQTRNQTCVGQCKKNILCEVNYVIPADYNKCLNS